MDFGFGEERGKLPFSYSSSSSSPSSSSQYKTANLMPLGNNERWESRLYDTYQQQPRVFELMAGNDEEVMKRCGDSDGHGSRGSFCMEKEHMFDKVVTPSDVGKLNRLVIPKQHAEKYFPLDSSTNEKGLLLNFEDLNGKPWRFRYSYWNSSQSYVMTKGWSRFVKEKRLDAGDIVSFQRGVGEAGKDHLYIDWRRRPDAPEPAATLGGNIALIPHQFAFHHHHHSVPWSPLLLRSMPAATSLSMPRDHLHLSHLNNNVVHRGGAAVYGSVMNQNPQPNCSNGSMVYFRPAPAGPQAQPLAAAQVQQGGGVQRMVFDSVPVVHGKAGAKRLRLFGVNMDCPIPESDRNREAAGSQPLPRLSSSNSQSPLQLRLFNSTAIPPSFLSNEKPTSMSLDFDL